MILCIILFVFIGYFLLIEVKQIFCNKLEYLKSPWNYIDVCTPCLLIAVLVIHLKKKDTTLPFNATLRSITTLLMWIKLIYFLRLFHKTSYFIRILKDVFYDMRVFLLVLLFIYFGFGEAFKRISEQSNADATFIHQNNYALAIVYTLRLSLGDFMTD